MHLLRKDIGGKLYSLIIIVLVFSIVYQSIFFITNFKEKSKTQVKVKAPKEELDQVLDASTDSTNSTDSTVLDREEEVDQKKGENSETNIFLQIMEFGLPYNGSRANYKLEDIIRYFTKVDISDPKTLISSQMPILDYEGDYLDVTLEEEKEIYNITTSKPLNDDNVQSNSINQEPLVLIYSTHTTESYASTNETQIDYSSYARSRNEAYNMVAVGAEISKVLRDKYSINVIQDTTVHDYPSYASSYKNSLATIKRNLEQYPSIKYVFDIHRDGLADNQKNKEKYQAVVNKVNTAKIMMVVGLNHENSSKNSQFSDQVYENLKTMYPSIAIPTVKRGTAKYNQFVRDYAVLFEVGSNLTTLEEAKVSGGFLGEALGKVIIENEAN